MANSQTLTSGTDNIDFGSSSGNTVTATDGTLTTGDSINAGTAPNTLVLSGPGTFDLTAPASLTGISTVEEASSNQTVLLRAGLPVTVTVDGGVTGYEDITLANAGDSFAGGASGSNTIRATAALISQDTIDGGSAYYSTLVVTGSNGTVSLANVTNIAFVSLTGANTTLDPSTSGVPNVWLKSTGDTVTLNAATNYAIDYVGGNTTLFTAAGDTLFVMPGSSGNETLVGFASGDAVEIDNVASAATVSFNAAADTVTVSGNDSGGNAVTDVFQLRGGYADNFGLVATANGYTLTYDPTVAVLTPYDDTVSAGVSLVVATDGTLTSGDTINPDPGATLDLEGAGTFNLSVPKALSNVSAVAESGNNEVVTTRYGLKLSVTDYGNNDVTTLLTPGDQFTDSGSGNTVSATASLLHAVTITGNGGTTLSIAGPPGSSVDLDSLGSVSGLAYVSLADIGTTFNPGASSLNVIYLDNSGDTVTLDPTSAAAVDYAGGNTIIFNQTDPSNPVAELLTLSEDATGDTLAGFDANTQVEISQLTAIDGPPVYDPTADTVTVSGTDSNGPVSLVFRVFGDYGAGTFTLTAGQGGAAGYFLGYTGPEPTGVAYLTTGNDTVGADVTTVVATDGTLNSGDTIQAAAGATLELLGAGTFDLTQPNTLSGISTVVAEGAGVTITTRSNLPVAVDLVGGNDTVTLANGGDSVAGGSTGNNTITLNDASRWATVDPGTGGGNQINFVGLLFNSQNPQSSFQDQAFTPNGRPNFQSAGIAGVGATLDPGFDYLTTLYTNSTGTTVILDPVDPLLIDASTGTNVFFGDATTTTETLSLPSAGSVLGGSENLYNFAPNDVIALGQFANDGTASATYDAASGTVVVTGHNASGNPLTFTFNLNGNTGGGGYDGTSFQIVPDSTGRAPGGVDLIYTGAPSTVPVLTTSQDSIDLSTLAPGTPIIAGPDSLSNGDTITGNQSEVQLVGAGTFNFSLPQSLSGITDVAVNGQNQDVFDAPGTPLTFLVNGSYDQVHLQSTTVDPGNANTVIVGAYATDLTVYATAAEVATATIQGTATGNTTLQIDTFYQNGQSITLGAGISNIQHINLANNGVIFDTGAYLAPLQVSTNIGYGASIADTVILRGAGDEFTDFTSSSVSTTVDLFNQNQVVDVWSDGTGSSETINGLNKTDTLHLWFVEPGATLSVSHSSDNTETVATVTGTDYFGATTQFVFNFSGDLTGSFTITTPNEQGVDIHYDAASVAYLTTSSDTVSAGVSTVVATDNTLSSGDTINPDAGSTLTLQGAGTFDLTQPESLTNIAAIQVVNAGANVTLRQGLIAPVTLSAAGNDTVTLADSTDQVYANGGASDAFNVTADQAANATIAGGPFSTLNISATGQWVTVGPNVTGIDYLGLLGTNDSLDPGNSGASLVYVYGGHGGGNTIVLNATTKSAIEYGSPADNPDNYFFASGNGEALTIEYANAPEQNLYGFDSTSQVVLAGFKSFGGLTVADESATVGAPATLVTVTGTDSSGNAISQELQLYGAYTNTFSVNPVTGSSGYVLTYAGTAPNNTLTAGSDTITGVSDVYAATGTINGGDSISTLPGGTLHLIGAGSFYINSGATITGVSTIIGQGPQQYITLIPNAAVTLDIASGGHDVIWNATDNSVIDGGTSGNNYAATTWDQVNGLTADLGSGLNNLIQINGASYALTLNASGIRHVTSFSIEQNGGITIDTGAFDATTGYGVNINIGVNAGATVGGDSVLLRGAGESVSDFGGGNNLSLLAENQIIWADMNGQGTPADTITGFGQTDLLDLNSLSGASVTQVVNAAADTTTLAITGTQSGHAYSQDFVLNGIYDGTFTAAPSSDGTAVTYVPCYAEGTRIAVLGADGTPRHVAVEALREGDIAVLHCGGTRPIVWIGSRRIDVVRHPDPDSVAPIRIAAGAVAPGQPRRDLTVSPDHAVMVDGVLIPARMLLNGASVGRLEVRSVRYFHVELDAHDILLAEGLPAESYLDTGNRATFAGDSVLALHPDLTPTPRTAGLPVAIDEATVRPAWARVAARAGLGTADTAMPAVPDAPALIVDGAAVRPIALALNRIAYVLPTHARSARLVSAATRPADARPWLDDRRRLGVAVSRLEADGAVLPLDGPDLRAGWHAPERDGGRHWRWTDGDAAINLPHGTTLFTVTLVQACRLPVADDRAAA